MVLGEYLASNIHAAKYMKRASERGVGGHLREVQNLVNRFHALCRARFVDCAYPEDRSSWETATTRFWFVVEAGENREKRKDAQGTREQ